MDPQNNTPVPQEEELNYTPASPVKRGLAWIGVVYMVIITALSTYNIYTGTALHGLAPLLAVPGLTGLGVLALVGYKTQGCPAKSYAVALAAACWLLAAVLLLPGIAGLMSNFT